MEMSGQLHAPAALVPEEPPPRVPIALEAPWAPDPVWMRWRRGRVQ
jgi:hypothetical protein